MFEYEELRIRIWKTGTDRYLVFANGPAAAAAVITVDRSPQNYLEELNSLLNEEFSLQKTDGRPVQEHLQELGRQVFEIFLPEPIHDCLNSSFAFARQQNRGLRVKFEVAPELMDIPLEILCAPAEDPLGFLVRNHDISIVRSMAGTPTNPLRVPIPEEKHQPLTALIVVASPEVPELDRLDVDRELMQLTETDLLKDFVETKWLKLKFLGGPYDPLSQRATRRNLEERTTDLGQQPSAVLVIAHGGYDEAQQVPSVLLEKDDGSPDYVSGRDFSGLLARASGLRFVALNLCMGTRSARFDRFSGVAQALIAAGIPAVVAMQLRVSDEAAIAFSPAVFTAFCRNHWVDRAIADGRLAMAKTKDGTTIEWCTPVLFLHTGCGYGWLFKFPTVDIELDDPLYKASEILSKVEQGQGGVSVDELDRAARYLRTQGEWGGASAKAGLALNAKPRTGSILDGLRSLRLEAQAELNLENCRAVCDILAQESRTREAYAILDQLHGRLHDVVLRCLSTEVNQAAELSEVYQKARKAEEGGKWQLAIGHLHAILHQRPSGYRDAGTRYRLATWYDQVEKAMGNEDWTQAAELCECILQERPEGYRDAKLWLGYAKGREAEQRNDWARAEEFYKSLHENVRDVGQRLTYVQGRQAAEQENWRQAATAYRKLGKLGEKYPDLAHRLLYAEGRVAEEDGKWEGAVKAYKHVALEDYRDARQRLSYARGRLAVQDERWVDALAAFRSLSGEICEVKNELTLVCNQLYQEGLEAEKKERWPDAIAVYKYLPKEFRDVEKRHLYTQGRAAERDERWDAAIQFYGGRVLKSYQDVNVRLPYARARAAEGKDRWTKAATEYARAGEYLDTRKRLPYARGRAAEQDEDWPKVVSGFGSLPDDYRDVGPRRGYARACVVEAEGKWAAVIEKLDGLSDEELEGKVGQLRRYAQGRLAEGREDWPRAVTAYEPLAEDYRDVEQRRPYTQGRMAETQEDWTRAAAAYELLAEDYLDVRLRRPYVQGRVAEEKEDWTRAADAYEALAEADYKDVRGRLAYARGRVAEQCEEWANVVEALSDLADDYRDSAQLRSYAQGRMADEGEDWEVAFRGYDACGDYRDAPQRQAYACGRLREAAGEWDAAARAYQRLASDYRDAGQRQERLTGVLEAVPWLDGMASAVLIADPLAVWDRASPYEALKGVGITPNSPTEEVKEASFALMEQGAMTPEARLAWDQVRSLAGRLKVDALLYRLQDVGGLRRLQQELAPGPGTDLVQQLCRALPDDAPLFLLLSDSREQAIEAWETRLRQDPSDASVAHALGLAYFWRAQELETNGVYEEAETAWEMAIGHWALVLSDDAYWATRRQDRANCYQQVVTHSDIARLRSEVGQQLLNSLVRYADRYAAEGRTERAEKYHELSLALEVELEGARALKEIGGLPLAGDGGRKLACGLLFLHHMGMETALGRLVFQLERTASEVGEPEGIVTALDVALRADDAEGPPYAITTESLRRLCCAFSELGQSAILLGRHQPERALRALPSIYQTKLSQLPPDCDDYTDRGDMDEHLRKCPRCQEFLHRNPAYLCLPLRSARRLQDAVALATRARLALAQTALTSSKVDLGEALQHWEEAIELARNAGAQVRTKRAIVRMVLGRVDALSQERSARRGERLGEAIGLIEQARRLIGGADEGQLRPKESELLTARGVWYGYGCHDYEDPDYEQAADDLRHALHLNPESLRACDNLARALIFHAANLRYAGSRQRPLELVAEALTGLHEGLRRTAGHRQLMRMLLRALDELEELILQELNLDELAHRLDEVTEGAPASAEERSSRVQELVAIANQKLDEGNVSRAITAFIGAVRYDPYDGANRQALLQAVERKMRRPS